MENNTKQIYKISPVSVIETARIGKKGIRKVKVSKNLSSRAEFSPFPQELGTLCAEFFCKNSTVIFDCFAGWGERHKCCQENDKTYIGYDISPEAIEYAKMKYGVNNILADSRVDEIPCHDGLITCPPYWNLEKYKGGGLSDNKNWKAFLEEYETVLKRCGEKCPSGSTYCLIVGDWRKANIYYSLSFETERIMNKLGFHTHDKVIVNQKPITPYLRMMRNCKRFLYTAKVHQYLLVFKKK
jgi:DNA modification methylase|tara:strand:+ start:812 stop:1534 length:723 start_codon:yes stop_codon:yes gene_type:complete